MSGSRGCQRPGAWVTWDYDTTSPYVQLVADSRTATTCAWKGEALVSDVTAPDKRLSQSQRVRRLLESPTDNCSLVEVRSECRAAPAEGHREIEGSESRSMELPLWPSENTCSLKKRNSPLTGVQAPTWSMSAGRGLRRRTRKGGVLGETESHVTSSHPRSPPVRESCRGHDPPRREQRRR